MPWQPLTAGMSASARPAATTPGRHPTRSSPGSRAPIRSTGRRSACSSQRLRRGVTPALRELRPCSTLVTTATVGVVTREEDFVDVDDERDGGRAFAAVGLAISAPLFLGGCLPVPACAPLG